MLAVVERFVEWLNGLNYALGETVRGQLDSGSPAVVLFVFLAGVVTSFTPCVYPVIPVTVTYIGGAAAGSRRRAVTLSAVYVLGLAVLYASLGMVSALLGRTFGTLSQSPWVLAAVGALIVLFGLAMFDLYTIRVPSFFGNVQGRGARRGGHLGAFAIGVASGFIAAPCTAPVLGVLLLIVGQRQSVVLGGLLLLVFSLGLGSLLMVLGIFSGMVSSLPRPGAWMDWVKKGFGVAMLALGAFFLWKAVRGLVM
jgi:thiol:disulfide interchange protein DsbD